MTVVLDDHLIRDWLARRDQPLVDAIDGESLATTNLWYARLCRSGARSTGGALLARLRPDQRRALIAGLVALPDAVIVVPMRLLAWKMGELAAEHSGLSTLGTEAIAAALDLNARLLVSARDDGPGIRQCCSTLGVEYAALPR